MSSDNVQVLPSSHSVPPETIYERMRRDILNGKLKADAKLGMVSLQKRYSVGNSPIREALNRLLPEGLVRLEPKKGFRVQSLSRADLQEITKVRCWLEDIAIRESIRLGGIAWEERIVLTHHRLTREPRFEDDAGTISNRMWEKRHEDFHLALLSACESKWLMSYCKNMLALNERYRRNDLSINYTPRNARAEHKDIMEAVIDRDADKASALLQEHCRSTSQTILDSLPE